MTVAAVSRQHLASLKQSGAATIANVLLMQGLKNTCMSGLAPLRAQQESFAGPAYTLRFIPSREDLDGLENYSREDNLHRRAIEECPAGSVLVIDAMDCLSASVAGDMMALRLKMRGVVALVTNGGLRDSASIIDAGLPAFQRRPVTPATPIALHPVELNAPIGCGNVAVYPGDIVVGDADALVVVPAHLAEDTAMKASAAAEYEEYARQRIRGGRSIFGLFPATKESLADFDKWQEQQAAPPEEQV